MWHQKGRERFADALSEAENGLVNSVNRFLKFGINAASLQYVLQLEEGQCFAALCASLCECYTIDWTAKIILQLIKKIITENSGDPQLGQMSTPSLQAISTLVDRYCGLFATSRLGVMMEEYMTYDGHGMVTGLCRPRSNSSKIPKTRGISSPEHIADALYEVIQLSRGKSLKVQFVGGADAVAIAAIGVWLVDLPTAFYTAEAQAPKWVASTHDRSQPARVVVLFSEEATDRRSLVQGRTVRLPTITDVLSRGKTLNPAYKVSGKLHWHTALSVAFGSSFKKLIDMESNFGPALGSAARVFQAFVDGDDNVPADWRTACQTYYENSFGIDYVHFAFDWFQELATPKMKEEALACARLESYSEAESKFEHSMIIIADICNCKYCCFNGTPTAKRTAATATNHAEPIGNYCLVALCSTIIRLVRVLSGIDMLGRKMRLNRSGLECFYNQQHTRLVVQRKGARNIEKEELFVYRIVEHIKVDKDAPEYSPLAVANTLFSGNQMNKNIQASTSAFAAQGICCFFNILQQKEPREGSVVSRVCVVPGTIEYRGQTYAGLGDLGSHQYQDATPHRNPKRPEYCVPEKIRNHTQICCSTDP
ncbi:hypothetical protein SLS58_005339 [Diplodia intermedia]|uniref:Uncharacterized protein n=1 Tax=Diplodia intermedia TaxID=856260 RepID=A0ABR3TQV9_9PEZI